MPTFSSIDLARWSAGTWRGQPPAAPLSSVSTDTRTIGPGALFVALRGGNFDGHAFLGAAFAKGAAAALVDAAFSAQTAAVPGPLLVVDDTRRGLMRLAGGYRASLPMQITAVTGSAGKTTVKEMTAGVLAAAGPVARTRGNWNNDIGVPLSLLEAGPEHVHGVYEVGMNHPGELAPLCGLLRQTCGIVTSVGAVHLEFFSSVRAIAAEKATVFSTLPPDGTAIFSIDDEWAADLRAAAHGPVRTVSLLRDADYVARPADDGSLCFDVTERATGEVVPFHAPLPGMFIVHDALLAIAAGRVRGIAWPAIVQAIANYRAAPMRWQREEARGVAFINDCYNANPLSMRAALTAFGALAVRGRRWVVLAGMRELGEGERLCHEEVGALAAAQPLAGLIVVGERGAWIAEGARRAGLEPARLHEVPDVAAAVAFLRERAAEGDCVLLKASRFERLERVFEAWKAGEPAAESPS